MCFATPIYIKEFCQTIAKKAVVFGRILPLFRDLFIHVAEKEA
jgi:hypothetical protein